ncbi:uncharacterized protein N7484_006735 [Penicillium longicatenatum]|uniref:uncharacterized protein n=1 Tax=Penicillium longicatenatum TaxID=1561947 RepID=UPI002546F830|nr:uncharacterized protein N7484_006735 [Penicillium longicatenatum]KAJ5644228.1 hypothetical protein N7484_006735 [Penicillium longicatenatum]
MTTSTLYPHSQANEFDDTATVVAETEEAQDTVLIHQPHTSGRQYIPIQPTLFAACRQIFQREGIKFHLAEIYLVMWASTGFQGLRENIGPSWLDRLQQQWRSGDFSSTDEQDITEMALSLNRKVRYHGVRISGGGSAPTVALIESIVPHRESWKYWDLKLSLPDIGHELIERTERQERVLEIISDHD